MQAPGAWPHSTLQTSEPEPASITKPKAYRVAGLLTNDIGTIKGILGDVLDLRDLRDIYVRRGSISASNFHGDEYTAVFTFRDQQPRQCEGTYQYPPTHTYTGGSDLSDQGQKYITIDSAFLGMTVLKDHTGPSTIE